MTKKNQCTEHGSATAARIIVDQVNVDAVPASGGNREALSASADTGMRKIAELLSDILERLPALPDEQRLLFEHRLGLELVPVLLSFQIALRSLLRS